jgi:catechol 2,3-dioxygenase-like lactoylglutathione lyase family enzyme
MQTITLEHVYLSVVDLDRTLAFYRRLFPDWVIRWEGRNRDGRWVHFGAPGTGQPGYLSLAEHPAAGAFEPYTRVGAQHVGFAHPDVDALIARLAPAIAPTDYVDDGAYRRAYFADPDGIELEVVQRLG